MIVWHHLSAYGLIAQTLQTQWPVLMDQIYEQARLAVHIFLVIAGYLAAQSLGSRPIVNVRHVLIKRYTRLVLPFAASLLWAILIVSLTRPFIQADWLPETPSMMQLLAHVFLFSEQFDFPALSSGVWYVAIDFQLYALFAVLIYVLRPSKYWQHPLSKRALSFGVAVMCVASLFWFNRHEAWDDWAVYFFGSYGLGILAAWAQRSRTDALIFCVTCVLGIVSLFVALRSRICLALVIALVLSLKTQGQAHWGTWQRLTHRLANSSYALFLTHFGVIVLFNALWTIEHLSHPALAVGFAAVAWLCSVAVGVLFHERVETTLHQWQSQAGKFSFWRVTN